MMVTRVDTTLGVVMLSKEGHKSQQQPSLQILSSGKPNTMTKMKPHTEGEGYTHCGNVKHNQETCFKIHGYPEWWHELKTKKKCEANLSENPGQATFISIEPQLSPIP